MSTMIECQGVQIAQDGDGVLVSLGRFPASITSYARFSPEQAMELVRRLTAAAHAASDARDQAQAGEAS